MYYKMCHQDQKMNSLSIMVYTYVMIEKLLQDFIHENIILFEGNT